MPDRPSSFEGGVPIPRLRGVRACVLALALAVCAAPSMAATVELAPRSVHHAPGGTAIEGYSERVLVVGIEVDRAEARVLGYTVKPRPYARPRVRAAQGREAGPPATWLEVKLHGPDGRVHTRQVEVPFLCLEHGRDAAPHEDGDTLRPHRTAVLVELPELPGFDRLTVAVVDAAAGRAAPRSLGNDRLDIDRFERAGGKFEYEGLRFADPGAVRNEARPKGSTVLWPEDVGDTELYRVIGDETEVDRRINLVLIPDGYTYAEKEQLDAHADATIDAFLASAPFTELADFYNFILVYAYSLESGIDECDCGVVTNNAMGTFFPLSVPQCGHSDNRCIRYGGDPAACDGGGLGNIVSAELRAPAHDSTLIMTNTNRWGGCASDRGVYAGANAGSPGIGVHEAGHSLGGLADEYGGGGCGGVAWEINTSLDPIDGAWPEWIADLGAPREGGQTFDSCVYRSAASCKMRSTGSGFCPVCRQWWTLRTFSDPRVEPTAPVESFSPPLLVQAAPDSTVQFDVTTRLPTGPDTDHTISWTLQGPGYPTETVVATGVTSFSHLFVDEGDYQVTCEVAAGLSFIKPERFQDNVDTLTWQVGVSAAPPEEVQVPIGFASKVLLVWDQVPGVDNRVYRGTVAGLPDDYGSCLAAVSWTDSFLFDAETPPSETGWTYLITGVSAAGEGTLGYDSAGNERPNVNPCP